MERMKRMKRMKENENEQKNEMTMGVKKDTYQLQFQQ